MMARTALRAQSLCRSFYNCREGRLSCTLLQNNLARGRSITTSSIALKDKNPESVVEKMKTEENSVSETSGDSGTACRMIEFRHYPSDYDKKRLTLAKMYQKDDFPEWVTHSEMAKAADLYRIRFNLKAIIFIQGMIIALIAYHKGERAKGNTINTLDTKYIAKMREIGLREEAEAAEKKRLTALQKLGV